MSKPKKATNKPSQKPVRTCTVVVFQNSSGFEAKCNVVAGTQNHVIGQFGKFLARLVLQSKETGTKIFNRDEPLQVRIELGGKSHTIDVKLQIKVRSTSQVRKFLIATSNAIAEAYFQLNVKKQPVIDVYTFADDLKKPEFVKALTRPIVPIQGLFSAEKVKKAVLQ